jgi:hypothetical protein
MGVDHMAYNKMGYTMLRFIKGSDRLAVRHTWKDHRPRSMGLALPMHIETACQRELKQREKPGGGAGASPCRKCSFADTLWDIRRTMPDRVYHFRMVVVGHKYVDRTRKASLTPRKLVTAI